MGIAFKNVNKPTPKLPRVIGNTLIMSALAIQPLIVAAPITVMDDAGKFYWSVGLALLGVIGKGFTMMFADEENGTNNKTNNGQD